MSGRIIYVIGVGANPVKVGIAADLQQRLSALQVGCPDPLVVHHFMVVPTVVAQRVEAAAHRILKPHHRRGEWFDVEADHAFAVVQERSERVIARVGSRLSDRRDTIEEVCATFPVSSWVQAAILHYRACLNDPRRKDDVARMNRFIFDAAGMAALNVFRIAVVERKSLEVVFIREPSALRNAKKALASALDALGRYFGATRQETLLAQISGNVA